MLAAVVLISMLLLIDGVLSALLNKLKVNQMPTMEGLSAICPKCYSLKQNETKVDEQKTEIAKILVLEELVNLANAKNIFYRL